AGRVGDLPRVEVRSAAGRCEGSPPAAVTALEVGRALPGRDDDVIQEDAEALERPVAHVRDRDLDLLAGEPSAGARQIDQPLLPAAGVAIRGPPVARRAMRLAVVADDRLVVIHERVDRAPPAGAILRLATLAGRLRRVAGDAHVLESRPIVLAHG